MLIKLFNKYVRKSRYIILLLGLRRKKYKENVRENYRPIIG